MKQLLCLIGLLGGAFCPLLAQNWTPEDSLRLQQMLKNEGEIRLNQEALRELEKSFGGVQHSSEDKPWLEPNTTLPADVYGRTVLKRRMPLLNLNDQSVYQSEVDTATGTPGDSLRRPRRPSVRVDNLLRGIQMKSAGMPAPTGMDFMQIFTKEFWNPKIKKRRAQTLKALKMYGDSITVHYKEKPRKE